MGGNWMRTLYAMTLSLFVLMSGLGHQPISHRRSILTVSYIDYSDIHYVVMRRGAGGSDEIERYDSIEEYAKKHSSV